MMLRLSVVIHWVSRRAVATSFLGRGRSSTSIAAARSQAQALPTTMSSPAQKARMLVILASSSKVITSMGASV